MLGVLTITLFSGCSQREQRVEYVDRVVKSYIPQKCVVEDAKCDFNRTTDTEVISSLLECIIEQKQNTKACK